MQEPHRFSRGSFRRSNLSDDEEYYQGDFYDLAIEFENNPK